MADNATLSLTIAGVSSTQLDILVKNSGAEPLPKALSIELKMPLYLVSKEIRDAVERAHQKNLNERTTASKESLANVVTAATGWSAWAATERTESLAVIRLINDLDETGKKVTPVAFAEGAQFNVHIPLTPQDKPVHVEIPYSYRYPNEGRSGKQTDGKLEMTSADATTSPKVTLTVAHPSPSQIKPGSKVKIEWEIENGVSATLYGPLPAGNSQLSLSADEAATYKIRKGALEIFAVGAATYILQAEVRGADRKPNEMVVRTLHLGILSPDDYAFLAARPKRVMPHGVLEVDWAVWGIEKTWLSVGNDYEIELKLTEQGVSQTYQGSGVWRVVAPETEGTVTALLQTQVNNERKDEKTDQFIVAAWRPKEIAVSGNPVGLAVAAPKMALITTEGFWLAEVGVSDGTNNDLDFTRVSSGNVKARLAVTAFDNGFVVLEQTNDDGLQLVRYTLKGQRDGSPVDLPDTVKSLVRQSSKTADLTALGDRVYIAVEAVGSEGYRRTFSVTFKPQVKLQREPLLEALRGFRLVVFDNALFALHQGSGHMFRFRQNSNGNLDQPAEAARAAKDGRSMIFRGLLVPLGRVLVVLGPTSIPQIESLDVTGLLKYIITKRPTARMTQDLVYNPQQDHWMPCGRGLQVQPPAVAAFRSTSSNRLWVVESNRKAYTLSGAFEHLFSPEFFADFPSKDLPPYFGKRKYTIKNDTGIDFGPMSDVYRKAGLDDFSAFGPAELLDAPKDFNWRKTETFEFRCNEAEPAPIVLRYMAYMREGVGQDYMLEIEFQGPGHSLITSVLKRLKIDEQGQVSVAEIPGTSVHHTPGTTIVIPSAKPLLEGVKLTVKSLSGYMFALRRPLEPLKGRNSNEYRPDTPITIKYDTPKFTLFVTGAGELDVDVDLAMPHGIEISPRTTAQSKLIRINPEKAGVLHVESVSFKEPDLYECAIRYHVKKDLDGIFIGDGVPAADGNSFYLAATPPQNLSAVNTRQMTVPSFVDMGSVSVEGKNVFSIFSVPNSIGVVGDRVAGAFGGNTIFLRDLTLQEKQRFTLTGPTSIVALAVHPKGTAIGLLLMKEEKVGQTTKYSYTYSRKKISQDKLVDVGDYSLDSVQGISTQNRVPNAPAWVSSVSAPPMSVSPDGEFALIGIDGGLLVLDVLREFRSYVIPIAGTGRAEAVLFGNFGELFCVHSQANNQGVVVSYIFRSDLRRYKSLSLPGAVTNMITDTRPLKTPALQYKSHPAVSIADVLTGAFCVSNGRTIYSIKKNDLSVGSSVTVDLPCRLIQVKNDRAPHGQHPIFEWAKACYIVLAIGASYTGDGANAGGFKTQLYRLGFE
ncbi:MAG TPA: hypothetical protein VJT15_17315 [Pyrinomonadaceae bacterium]|nr:hypothetical protein [Pyrinomonadaceae bacterium]